MKPLVVIGSAPCVRDDLDRLPGHDQYDHMAVGLSSLDVYAGPIRFIANNHLENIPRIAAIMNERHEACGGDWRYRMICPHPGPGVDIVEPYRPPTGSSAITGVLAAIRMGYRKIVLCGCPLTGNAPAGNPYEEFRAGWEDKQAELIGLVKSMSGWTRDLLGAPTDEWLSKTCEILTTGLRINRAPQSRWEYLTELAKGYGWEGGAELGIWYGKNFFSLLDALPTLSLTGVDAWVPCGSIIHHQDQAQNRAEVHRRQAQYADRSRILDMTTAAAARIVPDGSLDFVFIDAAHDYASVCADIVNWRPKLKPGGFLVGHDYDWPTVAAAVNDCLDRAYIHNAGGDHMWAWRAV